MPSPARSTQVALALTLLGALSAQAADVLAPPSNRTSAAAPGERRLVVGDADGDGISDIIWLAGSNITVILGAGDGTFGARFSYATGIIPSGLVAAGDVDGDGRADVLVAPAEGNATAALMLANPGGSYVAIPLVLTRASGSIPILADLDADGDLDAALIGHGITAFQNQGAGFMVLAVDIGGAALQELRGVTHADLDNDGGQDLILRSLDGARNGVDLFFFRRDPGTGALLLDERVPIDTAYTWRQLVAASNLDNDGDIDLVLHAKLPSDPAAVTYSLRNLGGRQFNFGSPVVTPDRASLSGIDMIVAEVDGDLLPDVIFGAESQLSREILVLHGAGAAELGPLEHVSVLSGIARLHADDLDCDGRMDLLGASAEGLEILLNRAAGLETELYGAFAAGDIATSFLDANVQRDVIGLDTLSVDWSLGQGCGIGGAPLCSGVPPNANAGSDISECTPPNVLRDFPLTGSASTPTTANALTRWCWTTDAGTFLESGSAAWCSGTANVTLRLDSGNLASTANVTLTVADADGCLDTDALTVGLLPQPALSLLTTSTDTVCGNATIDLIARASDLLLGTGLITLVWDFDIARDANFNGDPTDDADATLVAVSGEISVATATYTRAGTKTARVRARSENGTCIATGDVTFVVVDVPEILATGLPSTVCANQSVTGTATVVTTPGAPLTLAWDIDISIDSDGDGDPGNDSDATGTPATWSYSSGGTRIVRLRAIGEGGCVVSYDRDLRVFDAALPDFTAEGTSCSSPIVTFRDATTGVAASFLEWNFGDGGSQGMGPLVTHVFPRPGTYAVTLRVLDVNNCVQTITKNVTIGDVVLDLADWTFYDGQPGTSSSGNVNGFAEPGETIQFQLTARNDGNDDAIDVQATVRVVSPLADVHVIGGVATFPTVPAHGSALSRLGGLAVQLDSALPCATPIVLEFRVQALENTGCSLTRLVSLATGAPGLERFQDERRLMQLSGASTAPATAFGALEHVTVFVDASSGRQQIFIVRQDQTGAMLQPATNLSNSALSIVSATSPRIAWDATNGNFAAAWIETTGITNHLVFARISTGGQILGAPVDVAASGSVATPDLAWDGGRWILVWSERLQSTAQPVVMAASLSATGVFVTQPRMASDVADAQSLASTRPRVEVTGSTWHVAYVRGQGLAFDARVRSFTVGTQATLTPLNAIQLGASGDDALDLASFGSSALVSFTDASFIVRTALVSSDGVLLALQSVGAGSHSSISLGHDVGAVVYEAGSEVHARGVNRGGGVFGPELLVSGGIGASGSPSIAVGDNGLFLATWSDVRTQHAGNTEIYSSLLAPTGTRACSSFRLGDIAPPPDGDGQVNVADVVYALRIAVDLDIPTPETLTRGDVAPGQRNGMVHVVIGNGRIDVADVVVLLQASTGMIIITR